MDPPALVSGLCWTALSVTVVGSFPPSVTAPVCQFSCAFIDRGTSGMAKSTHLHALNFFLIKKKKEKIVAATAPVMIRCRGKRKCVS